MILRAIVAALLSLSCSLAGESILCAGGYSQTTADRSTKPAASGQ
jgi:hypothetical protein